VFGLLTPVADYLRGEAEALGERAKWMGAFRATSAMLVLAATAFGFVALYLWLAGIVGALYSALIIGGGLLVVALVITLIAHIWRLAQDRRDEERRRKDQAALFASGAATAFSVLARSGTLDRIAIPAVLVGAFFYFLTQEGKKDDDPPTE
jgi:hypothetical protein